MEFLKKKYLSIISLIIILLINYVLIYYINNDTSQNINTINYLSFLKHSLTLPGILILMDIFSNKIISNKNLFIFTLIILSLEFAIRYFNEKSIVDYNYVIGMLIGLILSIIIILPLINRNKVEKTQLN